MRAAHPRVGEIWSCKATRSRYEIVDIDEGWVRFRLPTKGRIPQPSSVAQLDGGSWGWFFRDGFIHRKRAS